MLLVLLGGTPALAQTAAADGEVTFTKDVLPILQRSCQSCHRPGAIAPMSLVSYEDVRPWARSIKRNVETREMPPWYVDRRIGIQDFKDDPSLTDAEIAAIAAWVDAGSDRAATRPMRRRRWSSRSPHEWQHRRAGPDRLDARAVHPAGGRAGRVPERPTRDPGLTDRPLHSRPSR